jgi:enoyl-CoA hydratase/carnithine racemase
MNLKEVFAKAGSEPVALVKEGLVYYLVLNTKMNMLNLDFIARIDKKLDEVENSKGEAVLVTVASGPKVFSSGFDLKFWAKNPWNVIFSL